MDKNKFGLILLVALFFCSHCELIQQTDSEKDKSQNRMFPLMRAVIDGDSWVANGVPGESPVIARYGGRNLSVKGTRYDPIMRSIDFLEIELTNVATTNTFHLGVLPIADGVGFFKRYDSTLFRTGIEKIGRVNLEMFDIPAKRAAGTFEFVCEASGGRVISVSQGAFDVKW